MALVARGEGASLDELVSTVELQLSALRCPNGHIWSLLTP